MSNKLQAAVHRLAVDQPALRLFFNSLRALRAAGAGSGDFGKGATPVLRLRPIFDRFQMHKNGFLCKKRFLKYEIRVIMVPDVRNAENRRMSLISCVRLC